VKSSRRVTLSFPTLSHVDYLNCSTTKLSPLSRTPTIYDVRKISRRSDHCVGLTSTIVSRSSKGTYNDRPFAVYVMTVASRKDDGARAPKSCRRAQQRCTASDGMRRSRAAAGVAANPSFSAHVLRIHLILLLAPQSFPTCSRLDASPALGAVVLPAEVLRSSIPPSSSPAAPPARATATGGHGDGRRRVARRQYTRQIYYHLGSLPPFLLSSCRRAGGLGIGRWTTGRTTTCSASSSSAPCSLGLSATS
jgi:hypothetical protein